MSEIKIDTSVRTPGCGRGFSRVRSQRSDHQRARHRTVLPSVASPQSESAQIACRSACLSRRTCRLGWRGDACRALARRAGVARVGDGRTASVRRRIRPSGDRSSRDTDARYSGDLVAPGPGARRCPGSAGDADPSRSRPARVRQRRVHGSTLAICDATRQGSACACEQPSPKHARSAC